MGWFFSSHPALLLQCQDSPEQKKVPKFCSEREKQLALLLALLCIWGTATPIFSPCSSSPLPLLPFVLPILSEIGKIIAQGNPRRVVVLLLAVEWRAEYYIVFFYFFILPPRGSDSPLQSGDWCYLPMGYQMPCLVGVTSFVLSGIRTPDHALPIRRL